MSDLHNKTRVRSYSISIAAGLLKKEEIIRPDRRCGSDFNFTFRPEQIHLFDPASERNLLPLQK